MPGKKKTWAILLGLTCISLTLWSVLASAEPSPVASDPELELRRSLNQMIGGNVATETSDKQARCAESVKFNVEHSHDSRPQDSLMEICLALPLEHDGFCGFPATTDEYYVLENQLCVARGAGQQTHAWARKVESRVRPAEPGDVNKGSGTTITGDEDATGAQ